MKGVTVVTSDKSILKVRYLFIDGPLNGDQNQAKKKAWVNLCVWKAAVEIIKGEKKRKVDIYEEMQNRYERWENIISQNDIGL